MSIARIPLYMPSEAASGIEKGDRDQQAWDQEWSEGVRAQEQDVGKNQEDASAK